MCKRFLVLLLTITLSHFCVAQKVVEGTLSPLLNVGKVNLELDLSEASIMGMSEDAFLALKLAERGEEWVNNWQNRTKVILLSKFAMSANGRVDKLQFGVLPDEKILGVIKIKIVDRDGDLRCQMIFRNRETGEVFAVIDELKAEGGTFGSFENLFGDGMRNLGDRVGRFVNKSMKK